MSDASNRTFDLAWSLPTGEQAADATIRPQVSLDPTTLPPLDVGEWSPLDDQGTSDLVVRAPLASGGMGAIYLARQQSLDRVVAIKRAADGDARLASALIREAKFMGRLNHPNIVPVYAVGRDADGVPAVVMKHIEGVSWRSMLDAPLDRHLEILEAVCTAVHFAHSRGVLHRDLKPDNVMVGAFGEVYLMDWGVAVDIGHVPERIAGTPAYFAPEQLSPGTPLSQATDVFQLGACLYEALTGRPPFMADTVAASLALAREGIAELPLDVPDELAAIALKALARAPAERFESAEALRERVVDYRLHAASMVLTEAAAASLEELRTSPESGERAFTEAQFGFKQALATSPDNGRAREGLIEALATMARRRADRGDVRGARALWAELVELDAADPELMARIAARAADLDQADARARDMDLGTFGERRARTFGALVVFSVGYMALWLVLMRLGVPVLSYESGVASMAFVAVVVWLGLWVNRDWLLLSAANRSLGFTSGFIALGMLLVRVASEPLGIRLNAVFMLDLVVFGVASSSASMALTPRLVWIGALFALGAVLIAIFPAWTLPLYTGFLTLGLASIGLSYWFITPRQD